MNHTRDNQPDQAPHAAVDPGPPAADDSRVIAALEAYVAALETGGCPERAAFLARYPDIAEALGPCLDGLEFVHGAGPQLAPPEGDNASSPNPAAAVPLGDFHLLREIGRGGMGVVYEAEQLSLGRRVALKVLPLAATLDPRRLQRFKNEAQAAAGLHHTNIVPVYFVGCERGVHYYAMQLIEGQTLAAAVGELRRQREAGKKKSRPAAPLRASPRNAAGDPEATESSRPNATALPGEADTAARAALSTERSDSPAYFRVVARLGIQAAEALEHAHQLGVIHRDIKPSNLMVDGRGNLWVTDFGLARLGSDPGLTLSGDLLGTLRYMSPEQALANRVLIDHRTDVYSLGATLYEILTLEPAFGGENREQVLRQIAFEEPARPRRLNPGIPAELETIVQKALEKNPQDRYATAQELADDLRRFLEDKPIRARRPGVLQRGRKWARRHKALLLAMALPVLALLLLSGNQLWSNYRQRVATELAVAEDLKEAEIWQRQEQWPKALQALERATGRLEGSSSRSLQARVEAHRRDVALVALLKKAFLQGSAVASDHTTIDYPGTDRAYAAAFAAHGLNMAPFAMEETSGRIRASGIRFHLVTALDYWAYAKECSLPGGDGAAQRAVAQRADDDSWRQRLRDSGARKDRVELERLAEEQNVLAQPQAHLLLLSYRLMAVNARPAALGLLRRAQERYPADFWINEELGNALRKDPRTAAEAVGFYRAALALQPQSPVAYFNLGCCLHDQKKLPEAIAAYRKDIELNPHSANGYNNLGTALSEQHKLPEAIAAYLKAIELRPDHAFAHSNLGVALSRQDKLPEALAALRKATALKPGDAANAYYNLGVVLGKLNKLPEAVEAYRKAIALKPNDAAFYYNLGVVLDGHNKLPEAVEAYRKAIALKPDFANAHCNLGLILQDQGQFADSLTSLRRGHELDSRGTDGHKRSAEWVRTAEQLVLLDPKLLKILKGETQPADAAERVALAKLCQLSCRQFYAASARFYSEAFAAEPKLASDLATENRYGAACAAALSGCGQGKDAAKLEAKEYARLRGQALDWLRADLSAKRAILEKEPARVGDDMQHWQHDTDFDGVRGAEALAKLPDAERRGWQQLWQDVEALARRAAELEERGAN